MSRDFADSSAEIHPNGIEGYQDEQERCDAAEEAAERLWAERNGLRERLAATTRAAVPEQVLSSIAELVDYSWASEERDFMEWAGADAAPNTEEPVHIFERMTIVQRWLEEVNRNG